MKDVSKTALATLRCHVHDAMGSQPLLNDRSSLNALKHLTQEAVSDTISRHPHPILVKYIVLRAREYDRVCREFASEHANAVIVNIGCGFDHRFERVDNGSLHFFDLDLPEVIAIKKDIFPASDRYHQLPLSVLDPGWMDAIPDGPLLLLAEGVLIYFDPMDVRNLFDMLCQHFDQFDLFFEVFHKRWLSGWKKKVVDFRMKRELGFGSRAMFAFGISASDELESWHPGLRYLRDWSFVDDLVSQIPLPNWMRNIALFRQMLWTVHYRYLKP